MQPDHETHDAESQEREQHYNEFVGLLARHDDAIRRFIRSLLPSGDGVDDVMQETALECWKKYGGFVPDSAETASEEFVRWACVIARYKVLSLHRDRSRDRLMFRERVIERLADAAHRDLTSDELERHAVKSCLRQMKTDHRRLVLSVHSPGESIAQIAEETGVKARRLYSKVNALRQQLLKCVQHRIATEVDHG